MNTIFRLILSAVAVLICSYILPGAHVNGFITAIIVAGVLSIVNILVKPIFVLLTIPVTILTFGLFLLFINTFMIMLVSSLVPGFDVDSFWWAFAFSVALSIINSVFEGTQGNNSNN